MGLSDSKAAVSFAKAPIVGRSQRLVIGNWKMNGSLAGNAELLRGILAGMPVGQSRMAVCVPFPYLAQVAAALSGTALGWGAQDLSVHAQGAYTGEVSAAMLCEFACGWVIVGHSERRSVHGEADELVAQKARAALQAGITPVVCVGESLQERDAGRVEAVIARQLEPVLALGADAVARLALAYEPVWAIGTGRTASPEQAQSVHAFIRAALPDVAKDSPILYGGSVKPDNARALFGMPDIDGGLIGGAALVAADFLAIGAA